MSATNPAGISLQPQTAQVAIGVLYFVSWSRCIVLMPVHTIHLQICDYSGSTALAKTKTILDLS